MQHSRYATCSFDQKAKQVGKTRNVTKPGNVELRKFEIRFFMCLGNLGKGVNVKVRSRCKIETGLTLNVQGNPGEYRKPGNRSRHFPVSEKSAKKKWIFSEFLEKSEEKSGMVQEDPTF